MQGNICMHLGIDSSTDLDDRYSNLFLDAFIYLKYHQIDVYIYQCDYRSRKNKIFDECKIVNIFLTNQF